MINTVEKIYIEEEYAGTEFSYKVIYTDGTEWSVPHDTANRHYQEILEWVENGGIIVDNGA
jgi:hypothetical protein